MCDCTYGGKKTAHCTACHRTFISVRQFDLHRVGRYDGVRRCLTPSDVEWTFVQNDTSGYWSQEAEPVDLSLFEESNELRDQKRKSQVVRGGGRASAGRGRTGK